jgi:hypothetical protein
MRTTMKARTNLWRDQLDLQIHLAGGKHHKKVLGMVEIEEVVETTTQPQMEEEEEPIVVEAEEIVDEAMSAAVEEETSKIDGMTATHNRHKIIAIMATLNRRKDCRWDLISAEMVTITLKYHKRDITLSSHIIHTPTLFISTLNNRPTSNNRPILL